MLKSEGMIGKILAMLTMPELIKFIGGIDFLQIYPHIDEKRCGLVLMLGCFFPKEIEAEKAKSVLSNKLNEMIKKISTLSGGKSFELDDGRLCVVIEVSEEEKKELKKILGLGGQ